MHVIKRISNFFGAQKATHRLQKKDSNYRPMTRLEKIRQKDFIYPSSTQNRFIFIPNLDGSGFRRQEFPDCPPQVPLPEMIKEINKECYHQWQKNRDHYQKNPFQKLNYLSNFVLSAVIVLALVLQLLVEDNDMQALTNYLFVFFLFITSAAVICLVVYFTKMPSQDTDALMVATIQTKLYELNQRQVQLSNNNPQFFWTSHKECLWIALRVQNNHKNCLLQANNDMKNSI